jgi:hypothetical protein
MKVDILNDHRARALLLCYVLDLNWLLVRHERSSIRNANHSHLLPISHTPCSASLPLPLEPPARSSARKQF